MRVFIVGTTGQLALELHRAQRTEKLELAASKRLDLSDPDSVRDALDDAGPGLVINAGAYTAVDLAEQERARAMLVNAGGPTLLAKWCSEHGAALLQVSTDYVFDGTKQADYSETDTPNPLSTYGESKWLGEEAVRSQCQRHLILRTSWLFSAHGNNFVKTILRLALTREELRVVADQRGRPTPAADLAAAIWLLADQVARGFELAWGTYHFAGAGAVSWWDFAAAIVQQQSALTGKLPRVVPITSAEYPTAAKRPRNSVLDTTHIERTFGISPASWHVGLGAVVQELQR